VELQLAEYSRIARGLSDISLQYYLLRKPEGVRPLGTPERRREDCIKMDLRDIGWSGMDWIKIETSGGFL
jgi:hypothetical protein